MILDPNVLLGALLVALVVGWPMSISAHVLADAGPRRMRWRILVETVLSMLTVICDIKRMRHRVWRYFRMHLAWTMAVFNLTLDQTAGQNHEDGRPVFSIADFVL